MYIENCARKIGFDLSKLLLIWSKKKEKKANKKHKNKQISNWALPQNKEDEEEEDVKNQQTYSKRSKAKKLI